MKKILVIILLFISLENFSQQKRIETISYKGNLYNVFPDAQKKDFNPYFYWSLKKRSKEIITKFPKDGKWIQFFENDTTKVAKIFEIKNGLPNGNYIRFNFNGDLKETGKYINGCRIGKWYIYDDWYIDGKFNAFGNYKSIDSFYYQQLYYSYHFIKSNIGKDSTWIYQNNQGKIIKTEFYKNFKKDSTWINYYPNGLKKEEFFYKNGELNGLHKFWNEKGQLIIEEEYKFGIRYGNYKEWYDDGKIKCDLVYQNDNIKKGKCILYYDTGEKYCDGKLDIGVKVGEWTYYYKNGNIWAKGSYQPLTTTMCISALPEEYYHSAMAGKWTFWDKNGNKIAQGKYIPTKTKTSRGYIYKTRMIGKWKYWNESGLEIDEDNFTYREVFNLSKD